MGSTWRAITEGLAGAAAIGIAFLTPFLNPRRRKWGATDAEVDRSLPGDELVRWSKGGYTHAVDIRAPATEVWPWLVQIGQGRGGFYSYESLENLIGCNIRNADRIIPDLQHPEIGDGIPMHPSMGAPYRVAAIEPGRALVLQIRADTQTGNTFEITDKMPEKYQNSSWVLYLDESGKETTRLISRSRNDWSRDLASTLSFAFFGPVSLMMDRKMLLGIKKRAETGTARTTSVA